MEPKSAAKSIEDKFGPIGIIFGISWIETYASAHPDTVWAAFGFLIFGGILTAGRSWFHDRFVASFNHDVLTPVRNLAADRASADNDFVQLNWILGDVGPRRAAWNEITEWCHGTAASFEASKSGKRLSIAVLVGRSGSGKSRLAHELARQLARRDLLGGTVPRAKAGWRLKCYLRRVLPFVGPRCDDPWDAGMLEQSEDDGTFGHLCARLEDWRPRRPTLILLDDPLVHWAGAARNALSRADAKKPFDHTVCFLVINQTVPADLDFSFDATTRLWIIENKGPASPQPVLLPVEAWFTPQETVHIAFDTGLFFEDRFDAQREIRAHLVRVTRGNPLLVEVAIERLRDGCTIADMTPDTLPKARAERIVDSFQHRGIDHHAQLAALALATLVGGLKRVDAEAAAKLIVTYFAPLPDELQGCFPTEPLGTGMQAQVPPVRPDLIGDAFVDCVIEKIGEDRSVALAQAAFRLAPAQMLRRLGRARRRHTPIAQALIDIALDPAGVPGLTSLDIALVLADVAAICQTDDSPLSTAESRADALSAALRSIGRLDATQKLAFCDSFARLCEIPSQDALQRQLRPSAVLALLDAATPAEMPPAVASWAKVFHALKDYPQEPVVSIKNIVHSAGKITEIEQAREFASFSWGTGDLWRTELSAAWKVLANADTSWSADALAERLQVMASIEDPEAVREAADRAAARSARFVDDPEIAREAARARSYEAYAWGRVPSAAQAAAAQTAADRAAAIAERFADNPFIAFEVTAGYRWEAHAWSSIPGVQPMAAQAAADRAAAIAERFAGNLEIAREAAFSRSYESYAWSQVPRGARAAEARTASDLVAAIAEQFTDDSEIARAAVLARRHESDAWCQVPAGAKAAAARTAADQAAAIAERFTDNPSIAQQAAGTRVNEAYAWALFSMGAQVGAIQTAADQAAAIAERFTDNPFVAQQAAEARRYQAWAWSQVPRGARAAEARAAADLVAAIAERFTDDSDIARAAALARRHESDAWCQVPAGANVTAARAAAARAAADQVAAIAERFTDPFIAQQAAEARVNEAYAWAQVSMGAQAAAAQTAADQVATVAERFTDNPFIAQQAAGARRYQAWAWSQVPAGDGATATRAAADLVAAVLERFNENPLIAQKAAEARRHEAHAWAQVSIGAQAAAAQTAADLVTAIAVRFADNSEIAGEAAYSRSNEGYGWSRVPAGGGAAAAHAAAELVAAIARRFDDDPEIASAAINVRRSEASAWSEVPAGAEALAAQTAADQAAAIAERFADAPKFFAVSEARRCVAYAWSQLPEGAGAAAAQTAADLVTAIAVRFANNSEISGEAAKARHHATYAWSQVPEKNSDVS